MKKIIVIFAIFLFLFSTVFVKQTHAHVLETDGSIGATLHISPDDDPVAGEQSGFFFDIKDRENKFDPKNCICMFSIYQNGKQLFSQDLFANNSNPSLDNASVFYTFPSKNIYTIKLNGKPKQNSFEPFTLSYDIRISRESETQNLGNTQKSNPQIALFILLGIGIFFVGIFAYKQIKGRKTNLLLVLILISSVLTINLVPLELFPHHHDHTDRPVHNKFLSIPKEISPVSEVFVNTSPGEPIEVVENKPIIALFSIYFLQNSRSPPVS